MNLLSWILLFLIMILVCIAIRFLYRNKGAGCTGNCMQCMKSGHCSEK